jgi:hypothetical protein
VFDYLHNVQTPCYIRCVCNNALHVCVCICILIQTHTHTRTEASSACAHAMCKRIITGFAIVLLKGWNRYNFGQRNFPISLFAVFDERLMAILSIPLLWIAFRGQVCVTGISVQSARRYYIGFKGKSLILKYYLYTLIHLNNIFRYDSLIGIYLSS